MYTIFVDPQQPERWVKSAVTIEERFGIAKALGYVIGEKLHRVLVMKRDAREFRQLVEEERARPDYQPIRMFPLIYGMCERNLDQEYDDQETVIRETEKVSREMVERLLTIFTKTQISDYLHSNPRFGSGGHILTEEEHMHMWKSGCEKHTLEDETRDALILGEMLKMFFGEQG